MVEQPFSKSLSQTFNDDSSALSITKRKSVMTVQSIKESLSEQSKTGDRISELGENLQQERVT